MNEALSLPSLPSRKDLARTRKEPTLYQEVPRAEELPDGSIQVVFTLIDDGSDSMPLLVHTAGIHSQGDYEGFMDLASKHAVLPDFPEE